MAVTTDDLGTPLGQQTARKRRFRLPFNASQALAALLGLFLIGFLGFAIFGNNPLGGEPVARVALNPTPPDARTAAAAPAEAPVKDAKHHGTEPQKPAAQPGQKTITIIDGSSGAHQEVVVSGDGGEKGDAGAAPASMAGINPRLLEKTRYGMVPVAAGGMTPFAAYAQTTDADRAKAVKTPSIALVIGGLGIGAGKTADAIMKLPPAVTLGFTPYGSDPAKLVERARAQHHEILLQIPMEPFDYPDNDPGPQTLLATLGAEQNLDRLLWHLSRFPGYVGLANFMGARFVATDAAMQPFMREVAKRGLGYLDDGSTPRSVAAAAAEGQTMPFAAADLAIDAVPTSVEIDRALARLESLSRERGSAIGMASALPISIERINIWAKTLESRGVMLVPLTTAMLKSKAATR